MPKYSNYVRTRIELLHNQGLHPAGILKTLKGEGLIVSLSGITRMIKKLRLTGSVANLPRSGRPRKLSVEARAFIDQQMRKNDEMTSAKIQDSAEVLTAFTYQCRGADDLFRMWEQCKTSIAKRCQNLRKNKTN